MEERKEIFSIVKKKKHKEKIDFSIMKINKENIEDRRREVLQEAESSPWSAVSKRLPVRQRFETCQGTKSKELWNSERKELFNVATIKSELRLQLDTGERKLKSVGK